MTRDPETEQGTEGRKARSGLVALIGRPNVGKSTLMNRCLGEKVAIVSDKPQTTRHRLVGILTEDRGQMVFFDTPGMHKPMHRMNRQMVQQAMGALDEADVVCLLVDASKTFGRGDEYVLGQLGEISGPKILALNKVDRVGKSQLLPLIARYSARGLFDEIVPISALTGDGVDILVNLLWDVLPEAPPLYDAELFTLHPERFLASERIREKVLEQTRDELPFTTAVLLDSWEELESDGGDGLVRILATLIVERQGQKKILVGAGGQQIKKIGTAARLDLEDFLGRRVYLDLRVRCEPNWRENRRLLARLDRDLFMHLA